MTTDPSGRRFGRFMIALQILLLTVMLLLCLYQVSARYLLHAPTGWTETAIRYVFVWTVFLGGSIAVLQGRHFNVDLAWVSRRFSRRVLATVHGLGHLGFGALLCWGGWLQVQASHRFFHPEIGMRQSVLYFPVVILGAAIVLCGCLKLWQARRGTSQEDSPCSR
ncbi:MAG TPA: TRAP transporter small permease [Paracoccus sp. (in: a-proteobacteria)]|uniref:TRAP transporter small permease n=1 Tax=Paracoccus sp. TaxID=267 RepID=UPI002C4DA02A|nr:TRAP transporter small permease [Paracoccus sp. (in: a-proteobacteria)]HWL55460.1 TRAP transporter small permease [Paracoccus sp. (in: a-proteobacteria)]